MTDGVKRKAGAPLGNKNAAGRRKNNVVYEWATANRDKMLAITERVAHIAQHGEEKHVVPAANWLFNRAYGMPAQSLDISGDITTRKAEELSDAELAIIATGGSLGAAEAEIIAQSSDGVH
jgi:hypothetical protein